MSALPAAELTQAERRILDCVARGLSNKAIGKEVNLSPFTVADHVKHIRQKLGVRRRTTALAIAVRAQVATEVAEACAALCDVEAERLKAVATASRSLDGTSSAMALAAADLATAIRTKFDLPKR